MSSDVFATGQCLCGAVSYVIKSGPVRMGQCHCSDCQRATGTGHSSMAFFPADQVKIKGETTGYASTGESGNIVTRHFCPVCGSRVFNLNSGRPGVVAITAGSADDSSWFTPQGVIFTKQRPSWDMTSADLPNFETTPPPLK